MSWSSAVNCVLASQLQREDEWNCKCPFKVVLETFAFRWRLAEV